jgi:uncharacterized membrane protein YccC
MARKKTLSDWILREIEKIAREQLRDAIRKGGELAGPALKKIGRRAAELWSSRFKTAKKQELLEAVNILQQQLHRERTVHARTRKRLDDALRRSTRARQIRRNR